MDLGVLIIKHLREDGWRTLSFMSFSKVFRALDKREYLMIIFLIFDRNHML